MLRCTSTLVPYRKFKGQSNIYLNKWTIGVGGMLRRRRSYKKKYLRKINTEATPKLPSRELRHSGTPGDEGLHRLKDEKTDRPMIICVMIVTNYKGHECKSTQATPCAYK